ncbi:conserved unknown protein [Ectocarpus siliculosus]|uniref:NADAR domain-containing protein n=1 Tax=Ectocarpus siliculosus TaxID=2880 RepID=D7FMJ5_ECTSI|nr:conserved unknown protein [Ectocarpus siliculosus]|eukprot:CBJ25892.1 conserved unknown protein [Ectocarpus siliculosus]
MWSSRRPVCALSACNEAVYQDPVTGQEHDFCGRTHATLFKQQQQQLQHQKAATFRPDRYKLVPTAVLRSGAVRNKHKSNPRPSGSHTSAGYNHGHPTAAAANGVVVVALPPSAQQTLPITHHTPKVPQALRVTDTMVLFWNPPCVFTQWEPALFEVDGVKYCSAEQYMMACKANVFGDTDIWNKIMSTSDPAQQKRLGKEVANYDHGIWNLCKVQFVLTGNYSKFTQNPGMCDQLLATGDKMLAEASQHDKVWGIGMDAFDPNVERHECWRGQNLLGKILMYVRNKIRWERPDLASRRQVQEAAAAMEAEHRLIPSNGRFVSAAGPAMTADSLGALNMTALQTQLHCPDMGLRAPVTAPPTLGEPAPEVFIAVAAVQQNKADTDAKTPSKN